MLGIHAVVAEFVVETEIGKEGREEGDGARVGFSGVTFQHVESARGADAAVEAGLSPGAEVEAGNEAEGVGEAVVQAADRRERMCERMDNAEVFLKRDRAHRGGDEHFPARVEVGSGAHGARQGVHDEADALERDAVAQRVERGAGEAFDAVGERVRAGGGGEFRRRPTVSSGSRMTSLASSSGWKRTALRCVAPSVMTELRPTSLPVPAVVGMAMNGARPDQSGSS